MFRRSKAVLTSSRFAAFLPQSLCCERFRTQGRLNQEQLRLGLQRRYTTGPSFGFSSRIAKVSTVFILVGTGVGYTIWLQNRKLKNAGSDDDDVARYQKVYDEIAFQLEERDEHDDGSFGPVLVRLSWHTSGTYDKETDTGGSNGATMRFAPEGGQSANAGLVYARDFLEPIKQKFPWITYSDLWTLGGVCAIQEMQGPTVPWRPGRHDKDIAGCSPEGRLPDAAKDQRHVRAVFGRMGFVDQEAVALIGAHALGRCHTTASGYDGPWTFSPTVFTNDYYKLLLDEKWNERQWSGPRQFQDGTSKSLVMLPTDIALINDVEFRKFVQRYAEDVNIFFLEFSAAYVKLLELGVPYLQNGAQPRLEFKRRN